MLGVSHNPLDLGSWFYLQPEQVTVQRNGPLSGLRSLTTASATMETSGSHIRTSFASTRPLSGHDCLALNGVCASPGPR